MFPPKPTADIEEVVKGLWWSAQRAGEQMTGEVHFDPPTASGQQKVWFQTSTNIKGPAWADLRRYIRLYAAYSGWRADNLSQQRETISFTLQLKQR